MELLGALAPVTENRKFVSKLDRRDELRARALFAYFAELRKGGKQYQLMLTSADIAIKYYRTTIEYRGRQIRNWAGYFLDYGMLPPMSRKGAHQKVGFCRSISLPLAP
jgi:hypothetical protein